MSFVHTALVEARSLAKRPFMVASSISSQAMASSSGSMRPMLQIQRAQPISISNLPKMSTRKTTDLPYNPEPQFPVEGFLDEQTIQPNHELDADDRAFSRRLFDV